MNISANLDILRASIPCDDNAAWDAIDAITRTLNAETMKKITFGFTLGPDHFDYLQQERSDNDLPPIPEAAILRAMDKAAETFQRDDGFNKVLNQLQDTIEAHIYKEIDS